MEQDKAAYWDGKDSLGQSVASGVYFYTLQAGEFRATPKMVIMKYLCAERLFPMLMNRSVFFSPSFSQRR